MSVAGLGGLILCIWPLALRGLSSGHGDPLRPNQPFCPEESWDVVQERGSREFLPLAWGHSVVCVVLCCIRCTIFLCYTTNPSNPVLSKICSFLLFHSPFPETFVHIVF